MNTKPLLFGIIGFLLGGLLVSLGGTIIHKRGASNSPDAMTTSQMTSSLAQKRGDDFDATFLSEMITHHQGAIDMAKLAQQYAKHPELKSLASGIISAQTTEISRMKSWQQQWGYVSSSTPPHDTMQMH